MGKGGRGWPASGGGSGEDGEDGDVGKGGYCTVLCYTCLYSEKETQGPARLRPGKKGGKGGEKPLLKKGERVQKGCM